MTSYHNWLCPESLCRIQVHPLIGVFLCCFADHIWDMTIVHFWPRSVAFATRISIYPSVHLFVYHSLEFRGLPQTHIFERHSTFDSENLTITPRYLGNGVR